MSYQETDFTNEMEDRYQTTDKGLFMNKEEMETKSSFLNKITKFLPVSPKKLPLTAIYCISFWNFGICVAIFGPTLLDLACQTSSTLSAMSFLYFLQNFSSLIGCFLSGILVKRKKLEVNDVLMISTLLMPVCVSLIPFSKQIFFLGLIMIMLGFNMGCIDNIANLAILKLHSNNVSPFIQTMHFFYGIGAFLTPIIVKLFLNNNLDFSISSSSFTCYNLEEIKNTEYIQSINSANSIFNQSSLKSSKDTSEILLSRTQFKSETKYAFWILALIQLPAPIILLILKLNSSKIKNYTDIELQTEEENANQKSNLENTSSSSSFSFEYLKSLFQNMPVLQMIILLSFLVFLFEGLQASHGGFIYSYTVDKYDRQSSKLASLKQDSKQKFLVNRHHGQHRDDAFITAAFWAFFSLGRLLSIFIATKFSSSFMIFIDIIGCIVASFIMFISSLFNSISLLYVSTSLLGLFLSNTTPTSYSLAEIHIGMTPTLTSFVIICAASGEMIFPLIVAYFFETVGHNSLITIEFLISIAAAIIFAKFIFNAKVDGKSYDSRDSFIWLNSNSKDSDQVKANSDMVGKTSSNMYYSKMEDDSD
ncbi:unnamed protein product [Brachionus calyciflorus]|uniref:Uncharacterized protein n=1 Tax=Brachionus calyciflorus TaxID=104777 RepID=A0A813YHW6_9BILA|nr:unnamed protein product [Brachionus calyciflorus]